MKNFKFNGQNITFSAVADVVSGEVVVAGDFVGVSSHDTLTGESGEMSITGIFELPKQAGVAMSFGDKAYYDTGAKEIDDDNLNTFAGTVAKDALAGDAKVEVLLKAGPRAFN